MYVGEIVTIQGEFVVPKVLSAGDYATAGPVEATWLVKEVEFIDKPISQGEEFILKALRMDVAWARCKLESVNPHRVPFNREVYELGRGA